MVKVIFTIFFLIILYTNYFAQPKPFGYKISGNGDIISDVLLIKDGFVLDSAITSNRTFRFEYDEKGKLKRDINFIKFVAIDTATGRFITVPGYRHYFYNEKGDVDSVGTGIWNGTQPEKDSTGYRISYIYDNEENILSKIYSSKGVASRIEESIYDSSGNLILNRIILPETQDTTIEIREYDSQNRLIKIIKNQPFYQLVTYKYENSGNINCLFQSFYYDTLVNNINYYLEFDQPGKLVNQIRSRNFNTADSTWMDINQILSEYDDYGKMVKIGEIVRFHYNSDGNIDTLFNIHPIESGYIGSKARLIDLYGNIITLVELNGMNNFYYSNFVTGIKGGNTNNVSFSLFQNYPNPFNPVTSITYSSPKMSLVTLKIYDMLGNEMVTLVNEEKQSGTYYATWNASNIASGVYFYKITAGEYSKTNKMLLLK